MPMEDQQPCEFKADRLKVQYENTIPCEVGHINPSVAQIMTLVGAMQCAVGKEFEVETALREALTNAIVHGCKNDPMKQIQICVSCDEARGILIVVRNPGEGFDPASIPSPILGQNIFSSHGRGIFLINQLMDEVRYEPGGTELHMRKK